MHGLTANLEDFGYWTVYILKVYCIKLLVLGLIALDIMKYMHSQDAISNIFYTKKKFTEVFRV